MSTTVERLTPLYRRLPPGPNGMDRRQVQGNQRTRLHGAMIEAVARNGYERTTVAHLIALAGVSRRSFYELFANKEGCFLSTQEAIVAQFRRRLVSAWLSERGWEKRAHAACESLLAGAARSPKSARLVLVDSLGIGPPARERVQLVGLVFERAVAKALSAAPAEACYPQFVPRAAVAGVRHVAFKRVLEGRHGELAAAAGDVLEWVGCHRLPSGTRLRTRPLENPALQPPAPAGFLTREGSRARVLGSIVHLTLDQGYAALSDMQVARFAGISTEAFHRHFASKQECFIAVLDEFAREAVETVRPAMESARSWEQAVCSAMRAYVAHLLAREALARIAFAEAFEVGPAIVPRLTRPVQELTAMLAEGAPAGGPGGPLAREAVTGAVWGILSSGVCGGTLARVPSLPEQLAFTVLAPYVGPRAAVRALEESARGTGEA